MLRQQSERFSGNLPECKTPPTEATTTVYSVICQIVNTLPTVQQPELRRHTRPPKPRLPRSRRADVLTMWNLRRLVETPHHRLRRHTPRRKKANFLAIPDGLIADYRNISLCVTHRIILSHSQHILTLTVKRKSANARIPIHIKTIFQ